MLKTFFETATFEHTFWLQVLGDHSRFILDSLSPGEDNFIKQARYFKGKFDQLLLKARVLQDDSAAIQLAIESEVEVKRIKELKLSILKKQLISKVKIHLSPTFLNHMVNELEEYERILTYLTKKEIPPVYHELHHHLLWLQDAYGHAGAIQDQMDATEYKVKKTSEDFVTHFQQFYLKAVEFTGYLRTHEAIFPALKRMNKDVRLEMEMFQMFLNELFELEISDKVLGTFPALMADHMFREECYYLTKLAESANTKLPECDPTRPRHEEKSY